MRSKTPRSHPSLVQKRAIYLPRKTSVTLEDAFWKALKEIATAKSIRLPALVQEIDKKRLQPNLSSAIRLFVLDYYRRRTTRRPSTRPRSLRTA